MNTLHHQTRAVALIAVSAALLAGCGGGAAAPTDSAPTVISGAGTPAPAINTGRLSTSPAELAELDRLPGLPKPAVAEPDKVFAAEEHLVATRYSGPRSDPFALKPAERSFEIQQDSARLLGQMGSWTFMYTPEPEKPRDAGTIPDPQPYRRLAGIIVGDSVYAILDSGDGSPVIIRPGMKVPNTEWVVVSIDSEKAILRRSGNKTPREITVRLESPPAGMGGGSTSGAPGGQMGPAGGNGGDTGLPGGRPGGAGPGGRPGGAGGLDQ